MKKNVFFSLSLSIFKNYAHVPLQMGPPGMPARKNKQGDMALDNFSYITKSFCTGCVYRLCVRGEKASQEQTAWTGEVGNSYKFEASVL